MLTGFAQIVQSCRNMYIVVDYSEMPVSKIKVHALEKRV